MAKKSTARRAADAATARAASNLKKAGGIAGLKAKAAAAVGAARGVKASFAGDTKAGAGSKSTKPKPFKTPATVKALAEGQPRKPGGTKKSGRAATAKVNAAVGAKAGKKVVKSFKGATPKPSAQGNMKRKGLKFQGARVRNVQKAIGGVTGRQKSQSRGTARPKGATTGPMTSMVNQQARIKREMARGNMAMSRKDGTKRAAGQTRRIQGRQRKVENEHKAQMAHHAKGMARALKTGNTKAYEKHQTAHRAVRQSYKTFVKGGRKVGQGG